jgi:hypothetical protein
MLGRLTAAGKGSTSLELTVPRTVLASAHLSAAGNLSATGLVTHEPADRERLKKAAALALLLWLYVVVPKSAADRLANWAEIASAAILIYRLYK